MVLPRRPGRTFNTNDDQGYFLDAESATEMACGIF